MQGEKKEIEKKKRGGIKLLLAESRWRNVATALRIKELIADSAFLDATT